MMRSAMPLLLGIALALVDAMSAGAEIPKSVCDVAVSVAVQDAGRIKPLDTFARFTLLQFSGCSVYRDEHDSIPALAWLLECLLDPETAKTRELFLIENPEVMEALGLRHAEVRERFSFESLLPARSIVLNFARQFASLPEETRTPAQKQMLQLAHNLRHFESMTRVMLPFRNTPGVQGVGELLTVEVGAAGDVGKRIPPALLLALQQADVLALIPPHPDSSAPDTWLSPAALLEQLLAAQPLSPAQADTIRALEAVATAGEDTNALREACAALAAAPRASQSANREYRQIPREVFFYQLQPFYWSLVLYGVAFLLIALTWMFPRNSALYVAGLCAMSLPVALHLAGIALRCLIRGRPPVSTLYETILFVTLVAVVVALLVEFINRRRVALAIAAVLGIIGLFLANKYEAIDRTDTMPNLIAVLDTNFWLATHVTTVTMGYAAGLLAGAIAHVYLIGKTLGIRQKDAAFYRHLTRMVYGVFCFGLLFATVGTVLGGIWANESWGRFWGWDPKENGALMIVLWGLAVLHARLGGYIRDYGLHLAAVFGGVVVAYSWFGVNLLGVGLHSYGFTSGIQTALTRFYLFESCVLTLAAFGWLREQGIVRIHLPERGSRKE